MGGFRFRKVSKKCSTITNLEEEEVINPEAIPLAVAKNLKLILGIANIILSFLSVFLMDLLLAAGSLSSHLMTLHGKAAPRRHLWPPPPDDWGAQDVKNEFPKGKQTTVPGGGMPGGV